MESEMALALLSTLAQNEVESLSANVKMGIKMKMKRGEMIESPLPTIFLRLIPFPSTALITSTSPAIPVPPSFDI